MTNVVAKHKKKRKLIINEKKLGRVRFNGGSVWGLAYKDDNLIEIDPRQKPKRYLNTLVHELLHIVFPEASEKQITQAANVVVKELWRANYRKTIL